MKKYTSANAAGRVSRLSGSVNESLETNGRVAVLMNVVLLYFSEKPSAKPPSTTGEYP